LGTPPWAHLALVSANGWTRNTLKSPASKVKFLCSGIRASMEIRHITGFEGAFVESAQSMFLSSAMEGTQVARSDLAGGTQRTWRLV
jgi:hypothetical protein